MKNDDKNLEDNTPLLPPEVVRRRFAIEYVRDFDPECALARTLGCHLKELDPLQRELAHSLPSDPFTNENIEQQLGYLQDRTEVDREFLILKTRQILDQCMVATPVMEKVRGQYVESGAFEFDSLGAIKAVQALYEITGIKQQAVVGEEADENTGVLVVPEQISPENWNSHVVAARDMQQESLKEIMDNIDPETATEQ